MNVQDIPRRKRRHYRVYKDGKITYSDRIIKKDKNEIKSSFKTENVDISNTLLNIDDDKIYDKQKINKVLKTISEIVKPNIDNISDAIYEQIKNDSFYDFGKEEVKETIKNSKHYRASKKSNDKFEVVESDDIESLVKDVMTQFKTNNIKSNIKQTSKSVDDEEEDDEKKVTEKKEKNKKKSKKKEPVKKKEKIKKTKKEDSFKDLLDDDEDLELLEEDEDDLGLKF